MQREPVIIEEIDTPFSSIALFRLFKREPHLFFLDSGMDRQKLGRFSFLGFDPFLIFRSKEGRIHITEQGKFKKSLRNYNPFHILKELLARYRLPAEDTHIPFTGGAVGYLSYDLCHHLENLPSTAIDDLSLPDSYIMFYDAVIIFDHLKDKTYIASCGFPELKYEDRIKRAFIRLNNIKERIKQACPVRNSISNGAGSIFKRGDLVSNFKKEDYITAIKRAKEYIASGDIYQVNLSQRFSCSVDIPSDLLFERLRDINPAPFSAYLDFEGVKVISASPERFLCKRARSIHTRPIKGTRPRSKDASEDERLKTELLNSEKDRAEHIMIVDLERNDLGRICEYGSVLPTEFIIPEAYSTVFHLVSTVSGTLREDVDAIDCLINCFPGGSITGAPKIRSMEIIDELEPTKRSIYTGSIGYIGFNGNMDTSIVIRTFVIKDGNVYFQVGGGIVIDSDPDEEYQETLDKAKALVESLGDVASKVEYHEV